MKALSYDQYQRYSEEGGLVPVYREMPGDVLTPVSAFLALAERSERAFLLESVVGGERIARFSFLGRDPVETLAIRGSEDRFPLQLRERLPKKAVAVPGLPRFTGGAVGYLTYDAVRLFERIPDRHPAGSLPLASFSFYRSVLAFDHVLQRILLITNVEAGSRAQFEKAQRTLGEMEDDLRSFRPPRAGRGGAFDPKTVFGDREAFQSSVRAAKQHIAAGDIFQIVLSRRAQTDCPADPFAVYRALRMVNPSPYMYFVRDGATSIAGASPEMLVRVEGGRVETRPIAGTRPRGSSDEDDERLSRELLADEKERAEHLMLVDLGRNDLGRVCRFKSVAVPELMTIERFSHVLHIVSSVTGELGHGKDALDALIAAFPAGTLTGAPKVRAMQLIDELEPARRGIYGGALGYIDLRGNLDFCITIRTVVIEGGTATVQAGAGIVADSDPEAEDRETEAKAGAMAEALRLAAEL